MENKTISELKILHEIIKNNPSLLENKEETPDVSDDENNYEMEKIENKFRFTQLELNNSLLEITDLKEKIVELTNKNKSYENTISYIKESLLFLNSEHQFNNNVSLQNITDYNKIIIDSARQFFKIEREYNKIKQYNNIDDMIKTNYDLLITKKFENIKKDYDKVNDMLKNIHTSMNIMKIIFYILVVLNLFSFIYNKF
jgi:hypothetical protein